MADWSTRSDRCEKVHPSRVESNRPSEGNSSTLHMHFMHRPKQTQVLNSAESALFARTTLARVRPLKVPTPQSRGRLGHQCNRLRPTRCCTIHQRDHRIEYPGQSSVDHGVPRRQCCSDSSSSSGRLLITIFLLLRLLVIHNVLRVLKPKWLLSTTPTFETRRNSRLRPAT